MGQTDWSDTESVKAYKKAYYQANKERIRERHKAYCDCLTDAYVANIIAKNISLSCTEIRENYPELIAINRTKIMIDRAIDEAISNQT